MPLAKSVFRKKNPLTIYEALILPYGQSTVFPPHLHTVVTVVGFFFSVISFISIKNKFVIWIFKRNSWLGQLDKWTVKKNLF